MSSSMFLFLVFTGSAGLLPQWTELEGKHLIESRFEYSVKAPVVSEETRYWIIQLPDSSDDWQNVAYHLKQQITANRARSPHLRVALEGSHQALDRCNQYEVAGYVDAYTYRDEPYIPAGDASAKSWLRISDVRGKELKTLLDAQALGVELVVFEKTHIPTTLQEVLVELAKSGVSDLDRQPTYQAHGIEQAHFFLDTEHGTRFLYLDATAAGYIRFKLEGGNHEGSIAYPKNGSYQYRQRGSMAELSWKQPGHMLYTFVPEQWHAQERVTVSQKAKIDPYEVVAGNQVFRERANEAFQSMVAREAIHVYPLFPGEPQFSWIERLVLRKGKPPEHHDLEMLINGVTYPQSKQREEYLIGPGRLNSGAMDIDLDLTYGYVYLGEEKLDGHACYKIGFRPRDEAHTTSGTIWIDQQTGAHYKMRADVVKPESPFTTFEYTTTFGWHEADGQRFWIKQQIEGKAVINFLSFIETYRFQVALSDIQFNRIDVAQLVAEAHASDLRIIRETDEGPRYMVKKDHKATRRRGAQLKEHADTERVEINQRPFATEKELDFGGFYDSSSGDIWPDLWFDYLNQDIWGTGMTLFAGPGVVALSNPHLFDGNLNLTTYAMYGFPEDQSEFYRGDAVEASEVETSGLGAGLSMSTSLGRYVTAKLSYEWSIHDYKAVDTTDAAFVLPTDHNEHGLQFELQTHFRNVAIDGFYRTVRRDDWQAWGFGANQVTSDTYDHYGFEVSGSFDWLSHKNFGYALNYLDGKDLDRFSRFEILDDVEIAGFGDIYAADRAAAFHLDYSTKLGIIPLQFGLDGGRAWLPEDDINQLDQVDLVGMSIGMLFNGPWKTDIGLELGYGLYASGDLEKDTYTLGLLFHRRL